MFVIALTGFMLIALAAMLAVPETPFGRLCHRELVERPARRLASFRSHHVLYALILIPVMLSGGEFIAILGPEFFAAYAMELAIYVDAVVLSVLASVYTRVRTALSHIRYLATRPLRTMRARRKRRAPRPMRQRRPANDDERQPAFALAA